MKKLLASIAVAACAFGVVAQETTVCPKTGEEMEALKLEIQTQLRTQLQNLPKEVQDELAAAKLTCENLRQQIRAMDGTGGNRDAKMLELRTQADAALTQAIQAMDGVSDEVKAQVEAVREQIQQRLQEKTAELQQQQLRIAERKRDGSGSGTGTGPRSTAK
jgi:DNA anti-recombination protein RmuC